MTKPWKDDRLAPNGKLVKENFSQWFGKSGIVDVNGEPMPVYHGTNASFDSFSYDRIGDNGRSEGAGFYFSTDRSTASGYGEVQEFFLAIEKPMPYQQKAFSPAVMCKIIKRTAELEAEFDGIELEDGFLSNFGDVRADGLDKVAREAARISCLETDALSQLGGLFGSGVDARHVNAATKQITGFDGVISSGFSNAGEADKLIIVAFFPEQIKSATQNSGLFDRNEPCFSDRQSALTLIAASRAANIVDSANESTKHRRNEP